MVNAMRFVALWHMGGDVHQTPRHRENQLSSTIFAPRTIGCDCIYYIHLICHQPNGGCFLPFASLHLLVADSVIGSVSKSWHKRSLFNFFLDVQVTYISSFSAGTTSTTFWGLFRATASVKSSKNQGYLEETSTRTPFLSKKCLNSSTQFLSLHRSMLSR